MCARNLSRRGWSLLELCIVTAIIGVLLGMIFAVVQTTREAANRLYCANNMRQLGLAVQNYHGVHNKMPPYASTGHSEVYGSWLVFLLPHLDQKPLYDELKMQYFPNPGAQVAIVTAGASAMPHLNLPGLVCASDPSATSDEGARTNYLANWYSFAKGKGFYAPPFTFNDISDGLSNTVFFAEAYSICDNLPRWALESVHYHNFGITQDGFESDHPYYAPHDFVMFQAQPALNNCDNQRTQSIHSVMQVTLGDGTVRSIGRGINVVTWLQLLKPCDGQPVDSNW